MKKTRRRIDVNLEELDRVLDGAREAPLSEADHDKLEDALHALAAMLVRPRNTEKTSAVVEKPEDEAGASGKQPDPDCAIATGTRPQWSRGLSWRSRVDIKHQKLTHGDRCPECGKGNVYGQKEPKVLVRFVGQAPLAATLYSLERLRCGACGQVFTAESPEGWGRISTMNGRGDDRSAQVRQPGRRSTGWNNWKSRWVSRCRRLRSGDRRKSRAADQAGA